MDHEDDDLHRIHRGKTEMMGGVDGLVVAGWLGQASHLNSLFLTTLGRPTASESIRQPWLMGSLTFFFVYHHIFRVGVPLPVYPFASVARVLLRFIALLLQVKCPFTLA